jgi:hypothetical protein
LYPLRAEEGDVIISPEATFFHVEAKKTRRGASFSLDGRSGLELDAPAAWALTRALSPRDVVRVASIVAHDGTIANDYDREWSVLEGAPTTPWAMYLSGDRERYDFLVFDFDSSHGNAVRDAGRMSLWLDELRIDHLTAESGPTGGRHIWISLDEPTDAAVVKEVSQLAKSLLPSLDVRPLQNPKTGCVRPPGAIHRYGGISRPLGALSSLLTQSMDAEGVDALRAFLLDIGAELPAPTVPLAHGVTNGADGHPHVPGDRRELSPKVSALLAAPLPLGEDASLRLATVLAGMANAHWQFADVAHHATSAPAFEHVRTVRRRASRAPRPSKQRHDVLARAWRHAVEYVASHPSTPSGPSDTDGTGYLSRLARTTRAVQALQERADTMPGLWGADRASQAARARRGTYSRRAVLDALCLFMVQAASTTVEADCRRLALHTGYGKTTTAEALRELATPLVDDHPESAWIISDGPPERGRGQRYRLSNRFSTEDHPTNRTQVLHGPPYQPLAQRDQLFRELGSRLEVLNLDVFAAPHSLGRHAGNVYRHLPDASGALGRDVAGLTHQTGLSAAHVRVELDKLARTGMATPSLTGWARGRANPTAIAIHLDVAGYLEDRAHRYQYERERWAQWLAELIWMHQSHKDRHRRPNRPDPTAVPLFDGETPHNRRPRYPRGPNGRADHTTALRLITARHAA